MLPREDAPKTTVLARRQAFTRSTGRIVAVPSLSPLNLHARASFDRMLRLLLAESRGLLPFRLIRTTAAQEGVQISTRECDICGSPSAFRAAGKKGMNILVSQGRTLHYLFLCIAIALNCIWSSPRICAAMTDTHVDSHANLAAITEALEEIRNSAREHESQFENLRVSGHFAPSSEAFELIIHNGRLRYERDVMHKDGRRTVTYWIDDGETFFSLSEGQLILNRTSVERSEMLNSTARDFWTFSLVPTFDGISVPVSKYCGHLLDVIEKGAFRVNSGQKLSIVQHGDLLTIEIDVHEGEPAVPILKTKLSLDRTKRYVMANWLEWRTSPAGPEIVLLEKRVVCQYREIAPGVFFLTDGTFSLNNTGKRVEELGQTLHSNYTVVVQSVEFGDFQPAESEFDVTKLPTLVPGISVHDGRVVPAVRFVYDGGPFDEQILERAFRSDLLLHRRSVTPSRLWILIFVNVIVFFGLAAYAVLRRRSGGHGRAR